MLQSLSEHLSVPVLQLQSCILKRLTASDLRQLHWSVLPCSTSKPAAVLQQSSARRRVKHLGFCTGYLRGHLKTAQPSQGKACNLSSRNSG
eukprot:s446_g11.t1